MGGGYFSHLGIESDMSGLIWIGAWQDPPARVGYSGLAWTGGGGRGGAGLKPLNLYLFAESIGKNGYVTTIFYFG